MPSCVFLKCGNYTMKVKGQKDISFHRIPMTGLLREKWLKIIRRQRREHDWLPTKFSLLCSAHFKTEDIYLTKKNLRKLKKTAIPMIPHKKSSSASFDLDNMSDEGSMSDTPYNTYLKRNKQLSNIKRRLELRNNNLLKIIRSSLKKNDLKQTLRYLKTKYNFSEDQFDELNIRAEAVEFTNRLIKDSKCRNFRQKCTPALRKFAVTLHYYSPAAYKYVREIYNKCLPHPRVIGKWYGNKSGEPGFNIQSLNLLKRKYINGGKRILCALVVDEMSIRQQTVWTDKKSLGVVDYGAGASDVGEIATQAYVFMLVCLDEDWKLPVAYFLVNGLPAEIRANLLKTCLSECYNVGVDIPVISFDGCAPNLTTAKILGCNLSNPWRLKTTFKHPECNMEVAVMLDACHMIKLVRNSFEAKRILFNGKNEEIRWQLIENLVKFQKNVSLNFSNKITARHIHFRNEIMKVKLATQIMSMGVANALKLCDEHITSSLFQNTEGTIGFVTVFNNLFDIFNSKSSNSHRYKQPVSDKNAENIFEYLEIARQYILDLSVFIKYRHVLHKRITMEVIKKKILGTKNKTGFLGFLVSIESLKYLYNTLVVGGRLQYIATHRFSLDHIELLFGAIRRHGYNKNPNAMQFKGIFNKILQHLQMRSSVLGNFIPLENTPILTYSSAVQNINATLSRRYLDKNCVIENEDCNEPTIENNVEILSTMLDGGNTIAIKQIIGYISGWVTKKLVTEIKCEICITYLFANNKMTFHKLMNSKTLGGLCFSSPDVFKICFQAESIIKQFIKENGRKLSHNNDVQKLKIRVLNSLIACNNDLFKSLHNNSQLTPNHRLYLICAIIEKFIHLRLHHVHKVSETNKRQQKKKLILFEGI